jgi:deoxyribonuclease V
VLTGSRLQAPIVKIQSLHPWRVSYAQAVAIQESLHDRLRLTPPAKPIRLVAGTDVAYSRPTHRMYAAVVVVALPESARDVARADLHVVDRAEAVSGAKFPYIPGLFTFREVPPLLEAFARLETVPDVILFDGHGLAHPRRFGLACHAGLLLDTPSVGCAKSRLVGEHETLGRDRGAAVRLLDRGDTIGAVVRTRAGVEPVYVSPGHLMDLDTAVAIVLATSIRYRIPEPIRLAHQATTVMRRSLDREVRGPVVCDYPDFLA